MSVLYPSGSSGRKASPSPLQRFPEKALSTTLSCKDYSPACSNTLPGLGVYCCIKKGVMWKGELRHWPSMVLNSCCWFGQLKPSLSMTERLAVTLFLLSITDMSQPWRWHNSSQDWYLHCQLPFHSQILKSRLSTLDTCLWGPVRTQWWTLSVFSRMILPGWQYGILHPRSSQTCNLGGLMSWCCSATLLPSAVTHSHGKTSPLIISATLTWIPSDLIFDPSFIYGEPWKT